MAEHEPVIAPDQLKPVSRKIGRTAAVITALLLVAMIFHNNDISGTELVWLVGLALALIGAIIVDAVLRRNGLRS